METRENLKVLSSESMDSDSDWNVIWSDIEHDARLLNEYKTAFPVIKQNLTDEDWDCIDPSSNSSSSIGEDYLTMEYSSLPYSIQNYRCSLLDINHTQIMQDPIFVDCKIERKGVQEDIVYTFEKWRILKFLAQAYKDKKLDLIIDLPVYKIKIILSQIIFTEYKFCYITASPVNDLKSLAQNTVYFTKYGRYYMLDRHGVLQCDYISKNLAIEISDKELTDPDFKVGFIKHIISRGYNVYFLKDLDTQKNINLFLKKYPSYNELQYFSSLLEKRFTYLICNCKLPQDEQILIDFMNQYLKQDIRLITIKLSYMIPHKPLTAHLTNNSLIFTPGKCKEYSFRLASVYSTKNIVKYLLEQIKAQPEEFVDCLIKDIASQNNGKFLCLLQADLLLLESLDSTSGNYNDFCLLLGLGASIRQVNINNLNTLLHDLAVIGNINAKWLLNEPGRLAKKLEVKNKWGSSKELLAACNQEGNNPLHLAILNNNNEFVEMLLEYEEQINLNAQNALGDTALHLAIKKDNYDLIELLLNKDVKINLENNNQETPLDLALNYENLKLFNLFVKLKFSDFPLHAAIKCKDLKMLKSLLNKCDLEWRNKNNQTPLYYAVLKAINSNDSSSLNIVKELLLAGADLSTVGEHQRTIFHLAVKNPIVLQLILGFYKNSPSVLKYVIDEQDLDGNTALHLAAMDDNLDAISKLMEVGATADILNNDNKKPDEVINKKTSIPILEESNYTVAYASDSNKESLSISPKSLVYAYNTSLTTSYVDYNNYKWRKLLSCNKWICYQDNVVTLMLTDKSRYNFTIEDCSKNPNCILSLSTGEVVTVNSKNQINIWQITSRGLEIKFNLNKQNTYIKALQQLNEYLISLEASGTIKIWDLKQNTCLNTIQQYDPNILCFALNQNYFIYGAKNGKIDVLSNSSLQPITVIKNDCAVTSLKFVGKENKELLIAGLANGELIIYDLALIKNSNFQSAMQCDNTKRHVTAINYLTCVDNYLVSNSIDGQIKFWHLEQRRLVSTLSEINNVKYQLFVDEIAVISESSDKQLIVEMKDLLELVADVQLQDKANSRYWFW